MNENENNFESLKRLLAFKKREIPPPGYFNNFSSQVLSRIRAGEAREPVTAAERLFSEAPWLLKFLQIFEAKPAYTGSFALALCLVLVFGIVFAERPDYSASQPLVTTQVADNSTPLGSVSQASPISPAVGQIMLAPDNTNPASSLQPVASLFGQQDSLAQQASFTIPSN
jgi:hypothetical protein